MRNIAMTVMYDGTNYCGWQVQPNGVSVASQIIAAVKRVTGETVKLYGSGRTDSGVHALAQAANFYTESRIAGEQFRRALNAYLPPDVVVTRTWEAEEGFNARFSSCGKIYQYLINNGPLQSPFLLNRAWHVKYPLDLEKMRQAAAVLEGTHDFNAFMAAGSAVTSTVRTLYSLTCEREGDLITITAKGNGFLYNMVRILAGTLAYAGGGKLTTSQVRDILEGKDRTKGAITAPPHGLYLKEVLY